MRARNGLKLLGSVAIIVALVWWSGPRAILDAFATVHAGWFAASLLVWYAALALGLLNIVLLVRVARPDVPLSRIAAAYLQSWAWGMIAPGKVGDLTLGRFLADGEESYALGLAVTVIDKLVSVTVLGVVAAAGLVLYLGTASALLAGAAVAAIVAATVAALRSARVRDLVRDRVLRGRASRFAGFSAITQQLLDARGTIALNAALTALRMVVTALSFALGLLAFGAWASPVTVFFVQAIALLATFAPFTVSGLGLRQATTVVLLQQLAGTPKVAALDLSLALLGVTYLNTLVFLVLPRLRRSIEPDAETGVIERAG